MALSKVFESIIDPRRRDPQLHRDQPHREGPCPEPPRSTTQTHPADRRGTLGPVLLRPAKPRWRRTLPLSRRLSHDMVAAAHRASLGGLDRRWERPLPLVLVWRAYPALPSISNPHSPIHSRSPQLHPDDPPDRWGQYPGRQSDRTHQRWNRRLAERVLQQLLASTISGAARGSAETVRDPDYYAAGPRRHRPAIGASTPTGPTCEVSSKGRAGRALWGSPYTG
jgi:hypothetical protein